MASLLLSSALFADAAPLALVHEEDVMESVRKRYPPLLSALAEKEIAEGELLSAEGRFDTVIRTRFDSDSFGYYANQRFDAWVDQPLSWNGMSLFSGYRVGSGEFAPYDGKLETRSLGEVRSGLRLPLFRDRGIDTRRGELSKARIGRRLADLSIDQQKLALMQSSVSRYWSWVAAGRRLLIAQDVLAVAEARQSLLDEGVRAGQLPQIDSLDNRRAILQRRSAVVDAQRAFQQSSIDLSLFYRDDRGQPVQLQLEQVPALGGVPPPLPDAGVADLQAVAWKQRPELDRAEALLDQNQVDLELARNSGKPAVDAFAGFFNEHGTGGVRRGPQEFRSGVSFEFPFQNRSAAGKQVQAEAKAKQLSLRQKFLKDQVAAEVQDAVSAARTALDRWELLGQEVRISRELEESEKARFDLGDGTLFQLNLREQATMDASIREALAQAEFRRARTSIEFATGAVSR